MRSALALVWLALRRRLCRPTEKNQPLQECWRQQSIHNRNHWRDVEFLAVDLETSSLNASEGEILSIGWVLIQNGRIRLNSARHILLENNKGVGDSATIHNMRDCELEQGIKPGQALAELVSTAANRVLVFHHAGLDLAYLNRLSQACYQAPLLMPAVDTMVLEYRKLTRRHITIKDGDLRLSACRNRYHLPDYPAHNAVVDALATAELLLAQIAEKGVEVKIGELAIAGS